MHPDVINPIGLFFGKNCKEDIFLYIINKWSELVVGLQDSKVTAKMSLINLCYSVLFTSCFFVVNPGALRHLEILWV